MMWMYYTSRLLGVGDGCHIGLYRDGWLWDMTDVGVSWEPHKLDRTTVVGYISPDMVRTHPATLATDYSYTVTTWGLLQAAKREGSWLPIPGWGYEYCCYDIIPLVLGLGIRPHRTLQTTLSLCIQP
jgi:hypothetical protein